MNKVTVIGIGRLGFPLALALAKAGYSVCGCDTNRDMIESIGFGSYETNEPGVRELYEQVMAQNTSAHRLLIATASLSLALNHSDLILVLVPTPTGVDMPYDTSILSSVLMKINTFGLHDKHVVICCTVAPGYCDKVGLPLLTHGGIRCRLSYSPEFVAQGEVLKGFANASLSLIGVSDNDVFNGNFVPYQELRAIHQAISPTATIRIMTRLEAEITKLALNSFLTLKIAYANHIADIAHTLDTSADPRRILEAIGTDSRIGPSLLSPGYGFAGPCLPRDVRALTMTASEKGMDTGFLDRISSENERHHRTMAMHMIMKHSRESRGQPIEFPYATYKYPCPVDMIDNSATVAVASIIKTVNPSTLVLFHDRPEVLDLVRARYGDLFLYDYM